MGQKDAKGAFRFPLVADPARFFEDIESGTET